MKFWCRVIACCFINSLVYTIFSQVQQHAVPFSASENLYPLTYYIAMPPIDSFSLYQKAETGEVYTKQFQFAYTIYTDLDTYNSGEWTETASGRVWRLGIYSENAYSIYISMQYLLEPGASLFVYGPGYEDMRGAFTSYNNNSSEVLSVVPVLGDKLIIELNIPVCQQSFGKLKITKIYHDYYNIFNSPLFSGLKSSNDCDEDINCANGRYWQTEKRSVCKIISNGGMGTGTLVGNTSKTGKPYLISAYHLISSTEIAAEALFIFNYETTGCSEDITTNFNSLSGASILSTTDHRIDFTLMELYERPPLSYRPFYAGWDARNIIARKSACIHHPFGNIKQIAVELHPLIIEDINMDFDPGSTWKVSHWEVGYTGQGSSGAPLFDEQHRVIGTLTGGRSTCNYPIDDYFTKFGVSWDTYPDPSNQLKYWLDYAKTGQLVIDGYDPYGFNPDYCDTSWNFSVNDKLGLLSVGMDWGWASGHNSAGFSQFAERFESPGLIQINGAYLYVAKAHSANSLAHIELKVWEGNQYPEKECYSELIFIKDLIPERVNFISFDSVLSIPGTYFVGYKINYSDAADSFALYQTLDREYAKAPTMYIFNEGWYLSDDPVTLSFTTSLALGISACYGNILAPSTNILNVYPNPCKNKIILKIPGNEPIFEVKCYDNNGRQVSIMLEQTDDSNMLYFNLSTGIYYLKIITSEKPYSARFVVLKD